eukprot:1157263-Pelagomonas_calceolata.AAC.22
MDFGRAEVAHGRQEVHDAHQQGHDHEDVWPAVATSSWQQLMHTIIRWVRRRPWQQEVHDAHQRTMTIILKRQSTIKETIKQLTRKNGPKAVHNGAHSHSGFDAAGDAKALGIDHLDHGCFEVQAHADKGRKKRTVSTMAFYIRRGLA